MLRRDHFYFSIEIDDYVVNVLVSNGLISKKDDMYITDKDDPSSTYDITIKVK